MLSVTFKFHSTSDNCQLKFSALGQQGAAPNIKEELMVVTKYSEILVVCVCLGHQNGWQLCGPGHPNRVIFEFLEHKIREKSYPQKKNKSYFLKKKKNNKYDQPLKTTNFRLLRSNNF